MEHKLPALPYAYNALEPHIDAQTMEIHYGKHHQAYVNKLNEALAAVPESANKSVLYLLQNISGLPEGIRATIRNNGGGHYNHSLFWQIMAPIQVGGGREPQGKIAEAIDSSFGNYAKLKEEFGKAAVGRFGSGWAWLVADKNNKLSIISTANQDSPVSEGLRPVLCLDVWEHAYYLKYQNRRPDYVAAFWSVVNWQKAEELLGNPEPFQI